MARFERKAPCCSIPSLENSPLCRTFTRNAGATEATEAKPTGRDVTTSAEFSRMKRRTLSSVFLGVFKKKGLLQCHALYAACYRYFFFKLSIYFVKARLICIGLNNMFAVI